MKSKLYPRNLFVYSAYWGTWSRVLQFMQGGDNPVAQVEVNLTAVNPTTKLDWRRVPLIVIRKHVTARSDRDLYVADLPDNALALMKEWLDEDTIQRLLHEDFLPQIDWDKYNQHCNGGCFLHQCIKD